MKKPKIVDVFRIAVNYKSGISVEFDCRKFEVNDGRVTWNAHNKGAPIIMNYFEAVESVWQVGVRKALVWE